MGRVRFYISPSLQADLWLFLITVIWSGTFVLIKIALSTLQPFTFTGLRFTIAFLFALVIWRSSLKSITWQRILQGTILGILYSTGFYLQTFGLLTTTVGNSAFITGSLVVFTPMAYWFIERRSIRSHQILGIAITFFGLFLFTSPLTTLRIGDFYTLCSAICWAFYIVYVEVFTQKISPAERWNITGQLVILQFGITFLTGLICAIALEPLPHFSTLASGSTLFALLYTAIFASVLATGIQTYYQRQTTPVRAALIFSLEPVLAAVLGIIVLLEPLNLQRILGGLLVLIGVLFAEIGEEIRKKIGVGTTTP